MQHLFFSLIAAGIVVGIATLISILSWLFIRSFGFMAKVEAVKREGRLDACPHNEKRKFKRGKIICNLCSQVIGTYPYEAKKTKKTKKI